MRATHEGCGARFGYSDSSPTARAPVQPALPCDASPYALCSIARPSTRLLPIRSVLRCMHPTLPFRHHHGSFLSLPAVHALRWPRCGRARPELGGVSFALLGRFCTSASLLSSQLDVPVPELLSSASVHVSQCPAARPPQFPGRRRWRWRCQWPSARRPAAASAVPGRAYAAGPAGRGGARR